MVMIMGMCVEQMLLFVLISVHSGAEQHSVAIRSRIYSHISIQTSCTGCIPSRGISARSRSECVMKCQQLDPLQGMTGFTYTNDGKCYCRPIVTASDLGQSGAYIAGPPNVVPDLLFDMECIIDNELIGSINGSILGGAELDPDGKIGHALYTDGVSQSINLGRHRDKCVANLDLCPNGLTLMLWLKTGDTDGNRQGYLSNGGHTGRSHGVALRKGDGQLRAWFRTLDKNWKMVDPDPPTNGVWLHVMMTWRHDIGGELYVDGQLRDQNTSPAESEADASDSNFMDFYIGQTNDVAGSNLKYGKAWYDDFRVYYRYMESGCLQYILI